MHSLLVATTSVAGENEVHLLGATPRGLRQEWLGTYERQPDGVDGCTPAYKRKGPKADKDEKFLWFHKQSTSCLLYTSPSPRDATLSRMPSSA